MRLGPMLALLLLPACSLARAPIVDRDVGPMDAGFDASLDAGPTDAPEGFDTPPDTGFDAPGDGGIDAPLDTGVDAPVDTGVDAGMPDTGVDAGRRDGGPPTCTTRYGDLPGYMECGGVATGLCRFYVDPTDSSTSCNTLCGTGCLGVYDDGGSMCAGIGGAISGGCPRAFDHMVCFCSL